MTKSAPIPRNKLNTLVQQHQQMFDGANVLSVPPIPGLREIIYNQDNLVKAWSDIAKNDYGFYIEYTHRGLYQHGKHTFLICKKLELVEKGRIKRLIITLPPRHSKSMTVTESFPSWFIGKNPERRVIQASYADSLARKFGEANRSKIEQFGPSIFDIKINPKTSAANNWGIQGHRGGMISTGIGGSITGEGADLLIIDDPVKNREEADSLAYREKVWNEWQNTLRTRLHPGAAVIIILTRWHEDDLVGRLLNPEYGEVEDWEILNLPAIAEEDDLLGREVGLPLWPEHGFDLAWAEATEKAVGSSVWASLYQQRPAAASGAMIKRVWWKRYNIPYDRESNSIGVMDENGYLREYYIDEIMTSWDMTFKNSEGTDMVVGQIWARSGANKFLLDQVRKRMDFPQTLRMVKELARRWPEARLKLVEDKANGPAIISSLKNEISGMVAVTPRDSKIARLSAVSPDIEAGNVFLPTIELAPWIDVFIDELATFPRSIFDDQVDATSQALDRLGKSTFRKKKPNDEQMSASQLKIHNHIQRMIRKKQNKGKEYRSYIRR